MGLRRHSSTKMCHFEGQTFRLFIRLLKWEILKKLIFPSNLWTLLVTEYSCCVCVCVCVCQYICVCVLKNSATRKKTRSEVLLLKNVMWQLKQSRNDSANVLTSIPNILP